MPITRATFVTPDGIERMLRFSKAAQFRMSLEKQKSGAVSDYFTAWAMMFDEDGNPPTFVDPHPRAGQAMTAEWLGENLAMSDTPKLIAANAEAVTGSVLEKKIVDDLERIEEEKTQRLSGLISGLSLESTSDLKEAPQVRKDSAAISGGSRRKNSTASVNATPKESTSQTLDRAS